MGAAEAVPQIVRNLTDADFMRGAAEVEKAVVYAAAATHQHIAGDAGVEAAGNKRQHIFLSTDWEAANTFIAPFHQQQTIVFNFQVNRHVRVGELHASRFDMLVQAAANVALNLN